MSVPFRMISICCLLVCVAWLSLACDGAGQLCEFKLEQNRQTIEQLDTKARVVELSVSCPGLGYCMANFHDPNRPGWGYCAKLCTTAACGSGYRCEVFVQAQQSSADLIAIAGKKVCVKTDTSL